jgi:hypothetical protein
MECIIVTRHKALANYMREAGICPPDAYEIPHAKPGDVQGRHVYGVLPLRLAALAVAVTEVPLHLEEQDTHQEISLERLRQIAGPPITYYVKRL